MTVTVVDRPTKPASDDVKEITKMFEDMLVAKDKEISELKAALEKAEKKNKAAGKTITKAVSDDINEEIKEKAMQEVQELGKIRRRLEEQKLLSQKQYDKIVEYTDPSTATINPRGDTLDERRKKIIASFQKVSEQLTPGKEFQQDDATFNKILEAIKYLVKEEKKEKKTTDEIFQDMLAQM